MNGITSSALLVLVLITASACQPSTSAGPVVTSASVPSTPAPAPVPAPESLVIYFDYGAASPSAKAEDTLDHAARLYREGNPVIMTVAGHTDSRGGEFANVVLSARRAAVVKAALVGRGIPAERLQIQAFGSSDPVATDGPNAPTNRRVVITWR
jgi:outer membrane protein OmpA-like peptidoglycan-associated protein